MTSGSNPRGRPPTHQAHPPSGGGGPFSGPNLPFTLIIAVCLAVLVWFLILVRPFSGEAAGGTTTVPDEETTTTLPGGATVPTQPTIPDDLPPLQGIRLEVVTHEVQFPVYATGLAGDDRIFVLERSGLVLAIDPDGTASTFMDLTDRVNSAGIENGLLGMAFHPDYARNGRIFIYYTTHPADSPDSRLSEFRTSGIGARTADRSTETILFQVTQEGIRHRAGMLAFGSDGYLYVAMGDGGMGDRSAQELDSFQGNIHRIDVDRTEGERPYAIPPDNPFVGRSDALDEIWAYGLRNPWRFAFDPVDDLIYIADVGQSDWEEINIAPADQGGLDYGWPNFEGTMCYRPTDGCDMDPGVVPAFTIGHNDTDRGCSVTGGFVYRGSGIPELWGHYFYGDWCNGWMRSFRYADGRVTDHRDWSADMEASYAQIPEVNFIRLGSFGLDADGELLVVDTDGTIFRVVAHR